MSFDKCMHSRNLQHNHDMKHFHHSQSVHHVLLPKSSMSDLLSVTIALPFRECILQHKLFCVRLSTLSNEKQ